MTAIKDSVHDHIEIDGVGAALLDTPAVQRLRRIAQLGTATLVYPSANHTRFEHALGVYHLASRALEYLGIAGRQADRVEAAALLHDVGHGPFSHNVEDLIYRHTGKYHDDVAPLIETGAVGEVLREHGLEPARIAALIKGEGELGQLVSGELDVDRMDYLVRDAHHTGVPYGTIDTERLVRELRFVDGELVLAEGNVQTAESLLIARALMNPTVYNHHVARISKAMLRRATERLLEAAAVTPTELRRMDDHELSVALREHEAARPMTERLLDRRLFKRAVWAEMDDVPDELLDADRETIVETEADIADAANLDPDHVVLDVPGRPSMTESTSRVIVSGEVRRLGKQSPLVQALRTAQENQWRAGVYVPASAVERVGQATAREFGMDTESSLVSEVRPGVHTTLDEY